MRRDAERRPDVVLVVELAELELRVRDAVVRIEIRAVDRPAAVRHPVAALEIDGVEQRAASAPDAERAAEEAQARLVEVVVRHADVLAAVEILRRLLEVEAAAFEQAYAVPELHQPPRQRDAGDAGADDADVALGRVAASPCSRRSISMAVGSECASVDAPPASLPGPSDPATSN